MRSTPRIRVGALLAALCIAASWSAALALAKAPPSTTVSVTLTTRDGRHLMAAQPAITTTETAPQGPVIGVNEQLRYQRVKGAGGAMTDSSAYLLNALSPAARSRVLSTLFGPAGLHLNFLRVPIGASDFTAQQRPYSYDDRPPGQTDYALAHFSIKHDEAYILPTLRQVLSVNPQAFLLADPWTAPAWMKANDSLDNVKDRGLLLPQAYPAFANYFVKFLRAYAQQSVKINAVAPANEPGNPTSYPGMDLDEPGEASFVTANLAPALRAAKLSPMLYGYDFGWSAASLPYGHALARSSAARSLTGLVTHCYYGPPTVVGQLHQDNARLDEIVNECSPGITPYATSELIISATRNWASTVALWNLALNEGGGPVQPPNPGCHRCTGVVTINPHTGQYAFTTNAYELGQFAHFVAPGAVRIGSNDFVRYRYLRSGTNIATAGLDDVAFQNPDGSKVLLAYNNSRQPAQFSVANDGRYFSYTLPAGATVTFGWDGPAGARPSSSPAASSPITR